MTDRLYNGYFSYLMIRRTEAAEELEVVRREIKNVTHNVDTLINLMLQTNSAAMTEKLEEMEDHRHKLQERQEELNHI